MGVGFLWGGSPETSWLGGVLRSHVGVPPTASPSRAVAQRRGCICLPSPLGGGDPTPGPPWCVGCRFGVFVMVSHPTSLASAAVLGPVCIRVACPSLPRLHWEHLEDSHCFGP